MIFTGGGATSGGLLGKSGGFEGFNKLGSNAKQVPGEESKEPELSQFEKEMIEEMRKNDEEIDTMVEQAIDKLNLLDFHA